MGTAVQECGCVIVHCKLLFSSACAGLCDDTPVQYVLCAIAPLRTDLYHSTPEAGLGKRRVACELQHSNGCITATGACPAHQPTPGHSCGCAHPDLASCWQDGDTTQQHEGAGMIEGHKHTSHSHSHRRYNHSNLHVMCATEHVYGPYSAPTPHFQLTHMLTSKLLQSPCASPLTWQGSR
jgi:hypothetical protein